jgi:hypothetical protein
VNWLIIRPLQSDLELFIAATGTEGTGWCHQHVKIQPIGANVVLKQHTTLTYIDLHSLAVAPGRLNVGRSWRSWNQHQMNCIWWGKNQATN